MADARYNVFLDGQRLEAGLLALLRRIEVRESDSEPTIATLRFKLAQRPSGEYAPIDDAVFAPAVKLAVELAAPGGMPVRLFEGFVTHVRPHFQGIEADCYVEVIGMDAAVLLDAHERVATYPDASDADAVEEVFGRYRISVNAEPTVARHEERRQLLVQRDTDWRFVQALARRNGFVCYFESDGDSGVTARFGPPAFDAAPQPDLTILRDGNNLRWLDLQYVGNGPARHVGCAIDPIAKRIIRGTGEAVAPALGEEHAGDAIEQALTDAGATGAQRLLWDPPSIDAAISAASSAATDRDVMVVEARGELDPALYRGLLRARRPVLVKGVGRRFAGAYYVRAVRTVIDDGVLVQTFVGERNAIGLLGNEDFGASAEEVGAA
jgi:hypothetical protein